MKEPHKRAVKRAKRKTGSSTAESNAAEHDRLQQRTDDLKRDHEALSRDRTPFNQADHDKHAEHLREHQKQLATHKRRQATPSSRSGASGEDERHRG
jgi:hypothetical protein